MEHLSAYEQHMQFMQDVHAIDAIDEENLHAQFDLLLSCIPNNGKLYKYRSLRGRSFTYAYDSLVNGYIWLPTAKTLNDDYDSVLITDAQEESKRFLNSITQDYDRLFRTLFLRLGKKYWTEDPLLNTIPFSSVLSAFDPVTSAIDTAKATEFFAAHSNSTELLKHFQEFAHKLIEDLQKALHDETNHLFLINEIVREHMYVYSMSESYDLGNMWAYYADSGQGFCIEYDYNRAKELDSTAMRYLLNTFKVDYSDAPKQLPMDLLVESSFFAPDNPNVNRQLSRIVMNQLLSKSKCWEHEREWRIVIGSTNNVMPVDIVSAIIIDERALDKRNAKALISLCRKRGWTVKIRKNLIYNTSHHYDDLVKSVL